MGEKKRMIIYEPRQALEVDTPKGRGRVFLVTEYGSEIEKVFTVILYDGNIWEFTNSQITVTDNITMGRKKESDKGLGIKELMDN